jgi:lipopolysaccharide biosynthesis regulator YciM
MTMSHEDQQALEHAEGYWMLGMFDDAEDQLDRLTPASRITPQALKIRLGIYMDMKRWKISAEIAKQLMKLEPEEVGWSIQCAFATRRAASIPAAQEILKAAQKKFPSNALIKFNLGCYAAQLNELTEAERLVKEAIRLDHHFKKLAHEDPDLEPVRSVFK